MAESESEAHGNPLEPSVHSFGDNHILAPRSQHTHTIILLHGRGSTGKEFADELVASNIGNGPSLPSQLPGWRWVFPSSRQLWSSVFQEVISAWFEAHSLTDIAARQDLQIDGIRESVKHIHALIDEEIERLGGNAKRLFLGGISQGGAVGLWALLAKLRFAQGLGGYVGASTWLPFATNIERVLVHKQSPKDGMPTRASEEFDWFVEELLSATLEVATAVPGSLIPVFLGHGQDDAYVDVELGRQTTQVLRKCGMTVTLKEYVGAEEEGHWFKVPDEIRDIYEFLNTTASA